MPEVSASREQSCTVTDSIWIGVGAENSSGKHWHARYLAWKGKHVEGSLCSKSFPHLPPDCSLADGARAACTGPRAALRRRSAPAQLQPSAASCAQTLS